MRELKNTIERAAMTAATDVVSSADLAFERMLAGESGRAPLSRVTMPPPASADPVLPFKQAKRTMVDEFERQYLARLLSRYENNLSRAAGVAGIERHYLRELLKKHGLYGDE